MLTVPARLARQLLSLGKQHGHETKSDFGLIILQEETRRFLALSRQIVNQQLQNWKVRGWVDLGRGRITIVDEQAVQRIAFGTGTSLARGSFNEARPANDDSRRSIRLSQRR